MTAHDFAILFVGNADQPELRRIHRALHRAVACYRPVSSIDEAVSAVRDHGFRPDCVLLAPLWPGQFDAHDVARILAHCPLARVLWFLGAWCQGGGRGPVRGVAHVCVAYPGAILRLLDDLRLLEHATLPSLALPLTASAEEQLERALETAGMAGTNRSRVPCLDDLASSGPARAASAESPAARTVAVCCDDPEFASVLADACQHRARRVVVARLDTLRRIPTDVLVWDATPWSKCRIDELRAYRAAHRKVPILAIIDFPRHTICTTLLENGATTILTKPLLLTDLLRRLDQPNGALDPRLQQ